MAKKILLQFVPSETLLCLDYYKTHDIKDSPSEEVTHDYNNLDTLSKQFSHLIACDAKRGTLRRKEGNGNESTGEKEERKT